MDNRIKYTSRTNIEWLHKTIGALAKINIGLGLLMLLASVGDFVFTNEAQDAVDNIVLTQLNYYRHRKITEEKYESKLRQSTLFRFCIRFSWKIGLVYSIFLMTSNVLLLVALRRNQDRLFCCWLTLTIIFDLGLMFIITIAFLLGVILLDMLVSGLLLVTSLLFLGLPTIPLCCLVFKLYRNKKSIKKEEYVLQKKAHKIHIDSGI